MISRSRFVVGGILRGFKLSPANNLVNVRPELVDEARGKKRIIESYILHSENRSVKVSGPDNRDPKFKCVAQCVPSRDVVIHSKGEEKFKYEPIYVPVCGNVFAPDFVDIRESSTWVEVWNENFFPWDVHAKYDERYKFIPLCELKLSKLDLCAIRKVSNDMWPKEVFHLDVFMDRMLLMLVTICNKGWLSAAGRKKKKSDLIIAMQLSLRTFPSFCSPYEKILVTESKVSSVCKMFIRHLSVFKYFLTTSSALDKRFVKLCTYGKIAMSFNRGVAQMLSSTFCNMLEDPVVKEAASTFVVDVVKGMDFSILADDPKLVEAANSFVCSMIGNKVDNFVGNIRESFYSVYNKITEFFGTFCSTITDLCGVVWNGFKDMCVALRVALGICYVRCKDECDGVFRVFLDYFVREELGVDPDDFDMVLRADAQMLSQNTLITAALVVLTIGTGQRIANVKDIMVMFKDVKYSEDLASDLLKNFDELIRFAVAKVTGDDSFIKVDDIKRLTNLIGEANVVLNTIQCDQRLITDIKLGGKVIQIHQELNDFSGFMFAMKTLRPQEYSSYTVVKAAIARKFEEVMERNDLFNARNEPVCVLLSAPAYQGKTTFMDVLVAWLAKFAHEEVPERFGDLSHRLKYSKAPGSVYWEGYANHFAWIQDEFLASRDAQSHNADLMDILGAVSTGPFPLNVAFGGKGKTSFGSSFVGLMSNYNQWDSLNMVCPPAFFRRIHFPLTMVRNVDYVGTVGSLENAWLFTLHDHAIHHLDLYTGMPEILRKQPQRVWSTAEMMSIISDEFLKRMTDVPMQRDIVSNIDVGSMIVKARRGMAQMPDTCKAFFLASAKEIVDMHMVACDLPESFRNRLTYFAVFIMTTSPAHMRSYRHKYLESGDIRDTYVYCDAMDDFKYLLDVPCSLGDKDVRDFRKRTGFLVYAMGNVFGTRVKPSLYLDNEEGVIKDAVDEYFCAVTKDFQETNISTDDTFRLWLRDARSKVVSLALSSFHALKTYWFVVPLVAGVAIFIGIVVYLKQFFGGRSRKGNAQSEIVKNVPKMVGMNRRAKAQTKFTQLVDGLCGRIAQNTRYCRVYWDSGAITQSKLFFIRGREAFGAAHGFRVLGNIMKIAIMSAPNHSKGVINVLWEDIVVKYFDDRDLVRLNFNNKSQINEFQDLSKYLVSRKGKTDVFGTNIARIDVPDNINRKIVSLSFGSDATRVSEPFGSVAVIDGISYDIDYDQYWVIRDGAGSSGDCGSVYIHCVNDITRAVIFGIHIARYNDDGIASPVYSEDLCSLAIAQCGSVVYDYTSAPSDMIMECQAPVGTTGVGSLKVDRSGKPKTVFVRTPLGRSGVPGTLSFREAAFPIGVEPSRCKKEDGWDPWTKANDNYCRNDVSVVPRDFASIFSVCPAFLWEGFDHVIEPDYYPKKLSIEDACLGIEGMMPGLDNTTSSGYYFKTKGIKRKALWDKELKVISVLIREKVDEISEIARSGGLIPIVIEENLKDELKDPCKFPRVFCAVDVIHVLWTKMVVGDLICHLKKYHVGSSNAVGVNPHSVEWGLIFKRLNCIRGVNWMAGDMVNMDISVPPIMTQLLFLYVNSWYRYKEGTPDFKELYACITSISRMIRIRGRRVFLLVRGHPSGHFLTALLNGFTMFVLFKHAFSNLVPKQFKFNDCVKIKVYGDDSLAKVGDSVKTFFNMNTLRKFLLNVWGMEYTAPDKSIVFDDFVKGDDISFLSRCFRFSEGVCFAPLKLDSIFGMLSWVRHSEDDEHQLRVNMRVALMESFHHGRGFYEDFHDKLRCECELRKVCFVPFSFDLWAEWYMSGAFGDEMQVVLESDPFYCL